MNFNLFLILLVSSVIIVSCSKNGGGGNKSQTKSTIPVEIEMYGTYQAILAPINTAVSGHLNGSLTLVRERDNLVADVRISGGPVSNLQTQTIHLGSSCPTSADDVNQDGFIDGEEAAAVYGKVLIPLDDDIGSQRMGLGTYPVTDIYGNYFWSRTTSFEKFMEDLKEEDINLADDYAKLGDEKSLSVISKVVIIRGVPESNLLPESVMGFGRMTKFQAMPIACGVIKRVTIVPGEIDNDNTGLPVPEGETVGGSSGADDGAIFTRPSPGTDGNYGEEETEDEVITGSNEVDPATNTGGHSGI